MKLSRRAVAATTKTLFVCIAICLFSAIAVSAQESKSEPRVSLGQAATALDANGAPALEATLRTTSLNGAPDAPVTNVRIVVKNISSSFLTYTSGTVTFYDSSGVRCGEGLFKLDALAQGESADTDAPGLRITCSPSSWRVVATNLVPRSPEQTMLPSASGPNLVISIDGEEHPIQLGKPMVLTLGDKQKTITVRTAP
ncbi:MAG TPA: hypothetical protein VN643_19955 [Pyrinomonadaceae bacterium]|nr:hypothetical protein [Pyrinomonadaceae bacterium]